MGSARRLGPRWYRCEFAGDAGVQHHARPLIIACSSSCLSAAETQERYVVQVGIAFAAKAWPGQFDEEYLGEKLDLGREEVAGVRCGAVLFEADGYVDVRQYPALGLVVGDGSAAEGFPPVKRSSPWSTTTTKVRPMSTCRHAWSASVLLLVALIGPVFLPG